MLQSGLRESIFEADDLLKKLRLLADKPEESDEEEDDEEGKLDKANQQQEKSPPVKPPALHVSLPPSPKAGISAPIPTPSVSAQPSPRSLATQYNEHKRSSDGKAKWQWVPVNQSAVKQADKPGSKKRLGGSKR